MSSILVGSAPDSWGAWFSDDPNQTPYTRFLDGTDGDSVNLWEAVDRLGIDVFAIDEHDMFPCAVDAPLPIAQRTQKYLGSCGIPSVHFN